METKKAMVLFCIALLAVIALAGNAQALVEPVSGQVNSTVAEGQKVMLYIDKNPADYVTVAVIDVPGYLDVYAFQNIEPMLIRNGIPQNGQYNATMVMLCVGDERDINENAGSHYINTLRNTTPTTVHFTGVYDGNPEILPIMELESCATEETFSKTLHAGWNLISLPLTPSDKSASNVLASVWENVSAGAVYKYNAETKEFDPASTMDPGIGYFVHVTSDCTWEYSGTPYTSISTELKQGLNMVGWLDCSKDVSDAVSSISGEYHYVARWNAAVQKFEVYNPSAPSAFNGFTTMDQGTGYFISAKQDCTLSKSC